MLCMWSIKGETDTSNLNQSQKKGIYCTDVLFLLLFIGFTSYTVSIMDNIYCILKNDRYIKCRTTEQDFFYLHDERLLW